MRIGTGKVKLSRKYKRFYIFLCTMTHSTTIRNLVHQYLLCDTTSRINVKSICTTAPWCFWIPTEHFSLLFTVWVNEWLEDNDLELIILSNICDSVLGILLPFLAFNMEQYNTLKHGENISTDSTKHHNHINMESWGHGLITQDCVLHSCGHLHWLAADRVKLKSVIRTGKFERNNCMWGSRFRSSGMWYCISWWVIPIIQKDSLSFIPPVSITFQIPHHPNPLAHQPLTFRRTSPQQSKHSQRPRPT
jgi:hypothetical protein